MNDDTTDMTDLFRRAAGGFASGVTVVTTQHGGFLYGLTATSFVSLSLNPLLVTVSINVHSPILEEIRDSGRFAINVLASDQQHVSTYFATRGRGRSEGAFVGIDTHVERTGAPIVTGALSWFDCRVHTTLDGGDHTILVGAVAAAGGGTGEPLMYMSGRYRALSLAEEKAVEEEAERADIHRIADSLSVHLHLHGMSPEQLIDAQRAVEPAAAALAARNATDRQLLQLRELVDAAEEFVDDPARYTPLSLEFHQQLGMLSANPAIAASVQALNQPRASAYAPHTETHRARRATDAHRHVLAAILARDEESARQRMAEHLGQVARGLPDAPRTE
ncbi:flavin reductase [Microbacterium sp.]|uniref:flavin reductase n=1 Tax=Microbacterium sp. TaxID=51671 RepID=UPI003A855D84